MTAQRSDEAPVIYGWTAKDVLFVQHWLHCQNATLKDLEDSSLYWHYWSKQKVMDFLREDFK